MKTNCLSSRFPNLNVISREGGPKSLGILNCHELYLKKNMH